MTLEVGPSTVFSDDVIGQHLEWYFTTRARGSATLEEIDAHFAPDYRWGWGSPREPKALDIWFARWRTLSARIERVEELGPWRLVVTTRLGSGVIAKVWFEMEEDAPHRILRTTTTEHDPAEGTADFGESSTFEALPTGLVGAIPPSFTTSLGPFGGYVAAIALRAAGSAGSKPLPLTISGHFVNAGRSGAVDGDVSLLRSSSRLESATVRLGQDDQLLFSGQVWSGARGEPTREYARLPESLLRVPVPAGPGRPGGPLNDVMETVFVDPDATPDTTLAAWVRLRPRARFGDAWADAARLLLPIDWLGVAAGLQPHRQSTGMLVASTLELSAAFHNHDRTTDWVLCAAEPSATTGPWATASVTVLSEDHAVLAVATLQLLLRG